MLFAMENNLQAVTELSFVHRAALLRHFLALDANDRRLRFGTPMGATALRTYVARIDFERDAVFGIFDEDLELVGVAHLARASEHAELGVSVLRARNWGMRTLYMHCLRENETMMYIARKQGMRIVTEQGEADAWLALAPADASTHFGEVFAQRVALFDYALKTQLAGARRLAAGFGRTPARYEGEAP